jgi:hypothetical protein
MCSTPSTPAPAAAPPSPETVKRADAEVTKARSDAKNAATKRYGISGTNITGGRLGDTTADTKKKTLGGN